MPSCQHYLKALYEDSHACINRDALSKDNIPETYGEILFPAMTSILSYIPITTTDVFYDLGSGLGKIALQVFIETKVKKSCGIEILPKLHDKALSAASTLNKDRPELYTNYRELNFELGSFFDLPLADATIILLGSACFSPSMLFKLGHMMNTMPALHTVISLRPLPTLVRLSLTKVLRIECSWDSALAYFFS
jgi:hypothetical protein